jgi:hypothetical protein
MFPDTDYIICEQQDTCLTVIVQSKRLLLQGIQEAFHTALGRPESLMSLKLEAVLRSRVCRSLESVICNDEEALPI